MEFTHLHVASCLSAHHGTAWPEQLVEAQSSWGAPAVALTDRDGLYGAVRHVRACLGAGVAPIVGAELSVGGHPVTVLAHGRCGGRGWASLCRLISAGWACSGKTGVRTLNHDTLRAILLGEDGPTCTVLLGPESDVGRAILAGDHTHARDLLNTWKTLLPGGITLDIVCHYTHPDKPASLPHAAAMLTLARETNTPAVLTNAVRYLTGADVVAGDILDSAAQLLPLGEFAAQPNAQAWLKPPEMMAQIATEIASAADTPRAATQLLDATESLAQRCVLDPATDIGWRQPKVPSLATLGLAGEANAILTDLCRQGLTQRYPNPPNSQRHTLLNRLDDELATIAQFGFATYFLTVADITTMIRDMGVRVQARGSGAGSLVNYVLGISSVDPIEHDLLFERFLGGKRETLPDIDLDVESARRHDICRAIVTRFGIDSVTLMATQNRYRARGAIRDAGAALGMDEADIDTIAKSLWRLNASHVIDALDSRPELVEVAALAGKDPSIRRLFAVATLIDRLPRHVSLHPCGVIVSDENLWSVTPTQPSSLGVAMSQYDKDDIDDMGLLKLDVLGVRMQSTIAHTLCEIERTTGEHVDLGTIADDDEPTFDAIKSTHTLGMFQIESPGQRELVGKMQPETMTDLIADISLFRPGPVKANMITPYVEAKLGFSSVARLHPRFRGFLADGRGVVIYHEHVLRIFADCMGISLAEADAIRRRMGHGATGIEQQFREATARRVDESGRRLFTDRHISTIWSALESFGSFGFCKAHACAFAVTTYESAWLKTHYPVHFMAGLLEHDPGMYPKRLLIAEARRLGIRLLGVDVNSSDRHWHVECDSTGSTQTPQSNELEYLDPASHFVPQGDRKEDAHTHRLSAEGASQTHPRHSAEHCESPWRAPQHHDADRGRGACVHAEVKEVVDERSEEHRLRDSRNPDKRLSTVVESVGGGRVWQGDSLALRLPFTEINGISDAQVNRLINHQPYSSITDVIERAHPSRPILIKLATIGAFDALHPERSRGDLIAYTRHLTAYKKRHEPLPNQDPLDFTPHPRHSAEGTSQTHPRHSAEHCESPWRAPQRRLRDSRNPDKRLSTVVESVGGGRVWQGDVERVNAELEILGADISAHLLDPWRTYLDELGVTPAGQLIHLKGNARVLVAGVRVASGTPPTKTGTRVAFVSLDDGTGVADVAFFDDAQRATGPQLFRSTLMVVEGNTRRTGELGVSVTATRAWDLTALADGTSTVHINTGPSD